MNRLTSLPLRAAAVLTVAALGLIPLATLFAAPASAHSVDSTAVSVVVGQDAVTASIDVPLTALDEALGTDLASDPGSLADSADEITAYLAEHLTVTGADGAVWSESFGELSVGSIEGVDVLSVAATVDPAGADTTDFTFAYDGVVADVDGHEATVVVTEADGDIYLAGTIDASDGSVTVGGAVTTATETASAGVLDMVGHGFHHVLAGADHLLFLLALLLPAPLLAAGRRWATGKHPGTALGSVVRIATAFTVGHSITLIAAALGWVSIPSGPVEVLVAASVAVAAVHAFRPLVRRGEAIIAAVFGLVHGLAFAGILTDLGLEGTTSLPALLAFNVGIELAQLLTIALTFPALYALSRTRWFTPVRLGGAAVALAAATGWALDRLGVLANPFAGLEAAAVANPWVVVVGLAALAAVALLHERWRRTAARSRA